MKKIMLDNKKQKLQVAALENGTVIDHIPSEKLFTVVSMLGLEHMTNNITIGFNLHSEKLGKKGIIKIADKFFSDVDINRIAVVAPHVKLAIIRNYEVVEKREVGLPDELNGIAKCSNPVCVTNNEPMPTRFHVVNKELCLLRCHYCEKEQRREDIEIIK
jgi:aspartate carbamoyltransferase regulatory subunit